jgi:hypothetical protein
LQLGAAFKAVIEHHAESCHSQSPSQEIATGDLMRSALPSIGCQIRAAVLGLAC